jgi:hypothetical protein
MPAGHDAGDAQTSIQQSSGSTHATSAVFIRTDFP